MHIDLCALGFEGAYDRVTAFARQWKVDQLDRVNSASKSTASRPEGKKDPINIYLAKNYINWVGQILMQKPGQVSVQFNINSHCNG